MSDFWLSSSSPCVMLANPAHGTENFGLPDAPQIAERIGVPIIRQAGGCSSLFALVLSCALHAASAGLITLANFRDQPPSAGDSVMEIEMVVADAEQLPIPMFESPPQPPDLLSNIPPSPDAAQAPDKKREHPEKRDEDVEIRIPLEEPEPIAFKAEDKIVSLAHAAPVIAASTQTLAAANETYRARVARHLAKFKRYPLGMHRGTTGGRVIISFSLGSDGRVLEASVIQPSHVPAINAEAIAMLYRAQPFPVLPRIERPPISFVIPVTYRLKE
jgi:TonB family protein